MRLWLGLSLAGLSYKIVADVEQLTPIQLLKRQFGIAYVGWVHAKQSGMNAPAVDAFWARYVAARDAYFNYN